MKRSQIVDLGDGQMNTYKEEFDRRIKDIKEHPEKHKHSFEALSQCCMVQGCFDTALMEAHSKLNMGTNGGVNCDVTSGPCSCGAFH
jgi:hypothetical protein